MSTSSEHSGSTSPPETRDDKPRPADSRPRQIARKVVPIAVTAVLAVAAVLFWQRLSKKQEPEKPPDMGPLPVQTVSVESESVPTYPRFLGKTEGSLVVSVRARVAGYLVDRFFKEGQHVKKGDKLFQIDPRPFEADLNLAKAKYVSAQATLARAQSQLKRYQELLEKKSTTSGEFEDVEKDERVAAASVEQEKANVDSASLQLEYTAITSPIDGLIGQALKEVGSYVDSSTGGEVAEIQTSDPMYVKFSVTEGDILKVQKQIADKKLDSPPIDRLRFKLTLSDGSEYPQIASLNYADVKIDNSTGSGIVRGTVPNPDNKLKPGMFVYATIQDQKLLGVLRVPQAAVAQSPAGASVYVVNDKETAELRTVTLGEWSGGDKWIIAKGLKPGDRVITDRLPMLRPGMPVKTGGPAQPASAEQSGEKPAEAPAGGAS